MSVALRRILIGAAVIGAIATASLLRKPDPVMVTVARAATGTVEATVANTRAGTVKSCRRTRLAPTTGGQVDRLLVQRGDHVEKGQPLIELWNQDLKAQVRLAQSEIKAAEANREQACLLADASGREVKRLRKLHEQGLASDDLLDKAQSEASSRVAACNASTAQLSVSRDRLAQAEAYLARTILVAPFPGIVAEINGEPGEFVTPSPPGIPTPPAVDLFDPTCLYVAAPIDEVDAPAVQPCMEARISLDAFRDRAFPARISRIAPYVLDVERQARTVEIEATFNEEFDTEELLPGYSADIEVILDRRENVLRIPAEALLSGDEVWLVDPADSTLHKRAVTVGLKNWQYAEVTSGLAEGDQVITSVGREGIAEGVVVKAETATP